MADLHRCSDCGYLTFRNYRTRELVEAELELRERGVITPSHGKVPPLSGYPLCFAVSARLVAEYRPIRDGDLAAPDPDADTLAWLLYKGDDAHRDDPQTANDEYILRWQVMHRERECAAFTRWIQGFTPKEHREMLDRQWQLDFQERREDADRRWRDKQAVEARKWREEQSRREEKRYWLQLIGTAVVATLVLALTQLLGSWMQAEATREAARNAPAINLPVPAVNVSPVFVLPTPLPSGTPVSPNP